jgi:hypothetical protein
MLSAVDAGSVVRTCRVTAAPGVRVRVSLQLRCPGLVVVDQMLHAAAASLKLSFRFQARAGLPEKPVVCWRALSTSFTGPSCDLNSVSATQCQCISPSSF